MSMGSGLEWEFVMLCCFDIVRWMVMGNILVLYHM